VTALPQTGLDDSDPAWSGDGRQIAFVSRRDGNAEIYAIQSDGSNLRRVTHHPGSDGHPAWLPGNSRLVFSSDRAGQAALFLADLDGSEPTRLTFDSGENTEPASVSR